jgi:two-component system alkaline phosphatase synthesis response regulator PhoP
MRSYMSRAPLKKKVMIVDDDKEMRKLLKRILSRRGFDVVEIENGEDCLTKIHKEKPCLVLLDRRMPDMDGWEVLRKIKEDDQLKSIKVAMLTSINLTQDDMMREEFDMLEDYVLKPYVTTGYIKKFGNK